MCIYGGYRLYRWCIFNNYSSRPSASWAIDSEQGPSAQPNKVGVIFDYPAIYNFNLSKSRSGEPVLTDGPHYFFYLFFL